MPRQFALVIGINHYRYKPLHSLTCAENDAVAMQAYLQELGFDEVYRYSDTSPPLNEEPTVPERANLLNSLYHIEQQHILKPEDCFWFFFSGHGASQRTTDYLLPTDGRANLLADTAISTHHVIRSLKRSGAGNLVLVLDMCRNEIPDKSIGTETERLARQEGIITLFSCSPGERSYELPSQKQGAFTYALLEALRGECCPTRSNANDLNRFLKQRVPELVQPLGQTRQQTPWLVAEPYEKGTQILLPSDLPSAPPPAEPATATAPNLDRLKADALTATYVNPDLDQAERLWEQIILLATDPKDRKQALDQIRRIGEMRAAAASPPPTPAPQPPPKVVSAPPPPPARDSAPPPPPPARDEDLPLESEKGVDYRKLRDLLKAGQWKEADGETANRMLQAMGKDDWFDVESDDLLNFPCKDLKTIDRLWVHYSKGKWGFSVQKRIWKECGKPMSYNDDWEKFGDRVGWRKDGSWQYYDNLTFDLSISLTGKFPALVVLVDFLGEDREFFPALGFVMVGVVLFSRAETCEL